MRHLDLFSGIGGFSLSARWAFGEKHEPIAFCEIDKFCQKVLKKHWPHVPIFDDIRRLDGKQFGSVDIISGGFPCQPFSVAGKQRGKEDDRHLWPEYLRIIKEARPRYVCGENVSGIINMELDNVLSDLEGEGYSCQTLIIPACAVNAPHRRDRVWIIAYDAGVRCDSGGDKGEGIHRGEACREVGTSNQQKIVTYTGCQRQKEQEQQTAGSEQCSGGPITDTESREAFSAKQGRLHAEPCGEDTTLPDSQSIRLQGSINTDGGQRPQSNDEQLHGRSGEWAEQWPKVAARLCRMDDGIPRRVDRIKRLKALGNSIVPQVAYQIFKAINTIEKLAGD